jgi:hypothetical protein
MHLVTRLYRLLASGPFSPRTDFVRSIPWAANHRPLRWVLPARLRGWLTDRAARLEPYWLLIDFFIVCILSFCVFWFFIDDQADVGLLWFLVIGMIVTILFQIVVNRRWGTVGVGLLGMAIGYLITFFPLLSANYGWLSVDPRLRLVLVRTIVASTVFFLCLGFAVVILTALRTIRSRRTYDGTVYDRRLRGRGRRASDGLAEDRERSTHES